MIDALDAIADAHRDVTLPTNPEREEFMRRLSEHEDIVADLLNRGGAELCEKFRMSRRVVVAAYDRATLGAGKGG